MENRDSLVRDAKEHVRDIGEHAKEKVDATLHEKADAARDAAAQEAEKAADAAEAATAQFDPGSLQAQAAFHIANQIEGVARHIRTSDVNALVDRTTQFARRNPLLFVGAAAALGFAATRFLKARNPEPATTYAHDDPWSTTTESEPHKAGGRLS